MLGIYCQGRDLCWRNRLSGMGFGLLAESNVRVGLLSMLAESDVR